MKNYIQDGNVINYTVPAGGVTSGDAVQIGEIVGVAVTDGDEGDIIAVQLTGVFELPKVTGTAFAAGDVLYLNTDGKLTATATDNPVAGKCWAAAASADTVALVRLDN